MKMLKLRMLKVCEIVMALCFLLNKMEKWCFEKKHHFFFVVWVKIAIFVDYFRSIVLCYEIR